MNRKNDDINVLKKVNAIVQDKLPGFASRYFRANMDVKTPRTLYGYALDLTSFFAVLLYYRPYIDDYESHKGQDFH